MDKSMDQLREEFFQKTMADALENFCITAETVGAGTAYVEGEPGNCTRVSVVVSRLPLAATLREGGGQYLVACLSPFRTSTTMSFDPTVHVDYVVEKLAPRGEYVNGGDAMGVTLCVRAAFELLHDYQKWEEES